MYWALRAWVRLALCRFLWTSIWRGSELRVSSCSYRFDRYQSARAQYTCKVSMRHVSRFWINIVVFRWSGSSGRGALAVESRLLASAWHQLGARCHRDAVDTRLRLLSAGHSFLARQRMAPPRPRPAPTPATPHPAPAHWHPPVSIPPVSSFWTCD